MGTAPEQSVIVVGAGPTGLALACELAAAGVSCTVLERRLKTSTQSRAMGLYSRTMEVLDLRGHADALVALGRPVSRMVPARDAAVDFAELDTRFPYLNVVPQSRTEEVLQQRALDLGVAIERDAEVHGLEQDASGVTLQVRTGTGEWAESADFVVGCDGAHSAVRELSGIAFRGRTYEIAPILADVRLSKPPPDDVLMVTGNGGIMVSVPYGDGVYRLAVARRDRPWTREPVTLEELSELLTRSLGFDPQPYDPTWLARFKIHQRIADQYRTGRVLLAGDAAHLHSPLGGQGLNLGIQDAVNLGWKLAAEVQGWAPTGLLDSYETERRPQAERILRATDRATQLATTPSAALTALRRTVFAKALSRRRVRRFAAASVSGLRAGYGRRGVGGPRLRAGQRVPDLTLPRTDDAPVRLYELMRDGRFVLLDLADDGRAALLTQAWGSRVSPVRVDGGIPELAGVSTLLVRPDGYAAWVDGEADPGGRDERVRTALHRWCGVEGPAPARREDRVAEATAPPEAGPRTGSASGSGAGSGSASGSGSGTESEGEQQPAPSTEEG
ncbi:FAD-dependent oxidoreductase [Streptomyces sp. AC512_CC834]|uniref:FAD-dependent oxidoreductase n=1 Tax=Streptomyces sp. AC512_CC834 TaxID=2823691 RepID=UPI001C255E84|nr:FAD-dependent oxidoreductase [Streptomyces sp. AC512_CC834]